MVRKSAPQPLDARIAELADRQHGAVQRSQLAALGLSGEAVDKRVQRGRLYPVHRGVYAVGRRGLIGSRTLDGGRARNGERSGAEPPSRRSTVGPASAAERPP